jgi:hypothetical protein
MSFYNNVFAATYKYYARYKTEAPRFSAVCVVTVSQIVLFFLILVLLKKTGAIDIFGMLPSKYYFIPVFLLWLFLVYRHYTNNRAIEVVHLFEQKPLRERRTWGILTIICFILPIIIIAFLLKK